MSRWATTLWCGGCGQEVGPEQPFPFRCPAAGGEDAADHLLGRPCPPPGTEFPQGGEANPFARFRKLLRSWHLGHSRGMADGDYLALVDELDSRVAEVDGHGFVVTPFAPHEGLGAGSGLWVKDETSNVGGSHKARHLFGLALHLEVASRVGLLPKGDPPPLAIASCGNAALAAAVVAKAARRRLRVFIPTWADEGVVERLRGLGAEVVICPRKAGDPPGDPAYLAFVAAVAEGALPFTCQGNQNGLTIEGGMTLGFELASQLQGPLDRLFIQVGGGALASATVQALRWAQRLGALPRLPALHAVQTRSGQPLVRAWRKVAERACRELAAADEVNLTDDAAVAALLLARREAPEVEQSLRHAATHRSWYMWPVEDEPKSIAHGILDDETYDWLEIVRGMIDTGGYPVVADEPSLLRARELGQTKAGIRVDATGAAGLAGLLELRAKGKVGDEEQVAVLFSGVQR